MRTGIGSLARSWFEPTTHLRGAQITHFESPLEALYWPAGVVFTVPVQFCTNLYFQGYSIEADNPYVATARDYLDGTHTRYEVSRLHRWVEQCRADSRSDLFREYMTSLARRMDPPTPDDGRPLPLPWKATPAWDSERGELPRSRETGGQVHYSHNKARENFSRLARLCESIRKKGYQPTAGPDGDIRGYFLKNRADYRFVIKSGMHRTAVLSAMEFAMIRVTFRRDSFRAIDLADVEHWPQVRNGLFTPSLAREFFQRYFQQ